MAAQWWSMKNLMTWAKVEMMKIKRQEILEVIWLVVSLESLSKHSLGQGLSSSNSSVILLVVEV